MIWKKKKIIKFTLKILIFFEVNNYNKKDTTTTTKEKNK